ncbi:MAG TPA: thioredoxin family protein [Candidatus Kapabacteria bacterium]|nr:thioredoxin family protein [Candidatus Kapabacteria bacterium]
MRGCKIFNLCVVWMMLMLSCKGYAAKNIDNNSILTENENWRSVYMEYEVDDGLIEAMSYKIDNLKVDVYFGIWCSDSKNNVPPFMKIIDRIERFNVNIPVNYYTVERKPTKETKYFVEEFKVERVPTFIFYKNGKEIGRIIENPKKTLIEDMMDIIF